MTVSVLVGSGKGGVGKSTVSANLALALAARGLRVGLMDADLYGPSVSHLFGLEEGTRVASSGGILPHERHGIKLMSMGSIVDKSTPVIWRGPVLHRALEQFAQDVEWGELDVLLADLPPGTGDTVLSLQGILRPAGALLVTTPQETSILDVRRAREAFRTLKVDVLGVVANMTGYRCPSCGETTPIWGPSALDGFLEESGAPLLGSLPLDPGVAQAGESGRPYLLACPDGEIVPAWQALAEALHDALAPRIEAAGKYGRIGSLRVVD